jgi:hypothetical protein
LISTRFLRRLWIRRRGVLAVSERGLTAMYRYDRRSLSVDDRTRLQIVEQSLAPDQALMVFLMDCLQGEGFLVSTIDWPLVGVEVAGCRFAIGVGGHPRQVRELADLLARCQDLVGRF